MLTKKNRLSKDKDFKKVFLSSKPLAAGKLSLRFSKNRLGIARFGFVISNKVDKRATRRNGLKRRLRAIARELISSVESGYDIVVVVRENYPFPYQSAEINKDFKTGLEGLGIIGSLSSDKNHRDISKNNLS